MKFTTAAISVVALALSSTVSAVQLQFDNTYDDRGTPLTSVACSDGANGLITRFGWQTIGEIPSYPNIGAVDAIAGFNSPNCGTCWQVTFTDSNGVAHTENILGIDHAGSGFNVAQQAMDELTDGNAVAFGNVDVQAVQVDASACGI
ncbi:Cerato-platanin [Dendrothele bispora CBS 962.96]|uniref:Cerato-platanin n=1 Tax=Dendrothele bispora (strain CBS 962.96) TaxID=1314807 RepID=A0A4S8LRU3_DENBC|nr:Cerato-platanin [Dendrothele bispora CBS 962.96]